MGQSNFKFGIGFVDGDSEPNGYDLGYLKFLVVDGNEFSRKLKIAILSAFQVQNIAEAGDTTQALKLCDSFEPDIITVAYDLKPMSGVEFTRFIRSDVASPNPFVPIIMVTSRAEEHVVKSARDAGCDEYLIKPISPKTFYTRVACVIERRRCFVTSSSYFGPDRRRHRDVCLTEPGRRAGDKNLGVPISAQFDLETYASRVLGTKFDT